MHLHQEPRVIAFGDILQATDIEWGIVGGVMGAMHEPLEASHVRQVGKVADMRERIQKRREAGAVFTEVAIRRWMRLGVRAGESGEKLVADELLDDGISGAQRLAGIAEDVAAVNRKPASHARGRVREKLRGMVGNRR